MTTHAASTPTATAADASDTRLWWASVIFLVAFAIHTADHLRRGADSITATLYVAGTISSAVSVAAITIVLTRHRLAPAVAVAVGFAQAIAFTSAHFLPRWSELSGSFPDQHVSWFSWFAAAAEVTGAAWLGICGLRVLRREGLASILVLRPQRLRPATTPARNGRHVRQRTRGPP